MLWSNRDTDQQGIALLGAMIIVLILSVLATTLLNLAGQEAVSASAGNQAAVAQQLADAAGELIVRWFHDLQHPAATPQIVALREKRNHGAEGVPSFFDSNGRSQFVGTTSQPDVRFHADNAMDDRLLNDPEVGVFRVMQHLGYVEELKVYAPSNPGLLCTVDASVVTQTNPPVRQSVHLQLGAVDLPPLRAAVQVSRHLGLFQRGSESPVRVHWGDVKVGEDLVLRQGEDLPTKSVLAPVTGQGYDETAQQEDRWMEAWVGGRIRMTQIPADQTLSLPRNLHEAQNPIPGIHLDQWSYEHLKRTAKRFGRYFAIDREGHLYPQGIVEPGRGLSPDEAFRSQVPGDQQGLIFIDTLDQTAPRADNLGVLKLQTPYLEGTVVMMGHVVLSPTGAGLSIKAHSPRNTDQESTMSRVPIQLTGVQYNGVLYASGTITVEGKVRLYGAVVAGETITSSGAGGMLEVWYDQDLEKGFVRGLPVVYRAPGTWMTRY